MLLKNITLCVILLCLLSNSLFSQDFGVDEIDEADEVVVEETAKKKVHSQPKTKKAPSKKNNNDTKPTTLDLHYTYTPIQVADTAMVRKLVRTHISDDYSLEGYLELSISYDLPGRVIVIHNGTELCRLSPEKSEIFLKQNPGFFSRSPLEHLTGANEGTTSPILDFFSLRTIREYGKWKTGIFIDLGYEVESDHFKFYWFKGRLGLSGLHSIGPVYLGGSALFQDYEGDLIAPSYNFEFLSISRERYGAHYNKAGFSITAGLDFIRYELKYDPWPIPDYYWLEGGDGFRRNEYKYEPSADSTTYYLPEGETGNELLQPMQKIYTKQLSDNFSHNLYLKAGVFRYHLISDSDIYQTRIHRFYVEDLPAIWGHWGFGVANSTYMWVPHFYIETNNSFLTSLFVNTSSIDIYTPKFRFDLIFQNNDYFVARFNLQFYFGYQLDKGEL